MIGPLAAPGLDAHDLAAIAARLSAVADAARLPATPHAVPARDPANARSQPRAATRRTLNGGRSLLQVEHFHHVGWTHNSIEWTLDGDASSRPVRVVSSHRLDRAGLVAEGNDAAYLRALADAAATAAPDPAGTGDVDLRAAVAAVADRVAAIIARHLGAVPARMVLHVVPPSPFGPGSMTVHEDSESTPTMIVHSPAWLARIPPRTLLSTHARPATRPGEPATTNVGFTPATHLAAFLSRRPSASDPVAGLRSHALVPDDPDATIMVLGEAGVAMRSIGNARP